MRMVRRPGASREPHPLVELGRLRILRAQTESPEPPSSRIDHPADELPADAEPPVCREHVQMTDPTDARGLRVGIDVEPAGTDQVTVDPRREQDFAGPVESILPARPLVGEPAYEAVSGALALGDEKVEQTRRHLREALDLDPARAHTHTLSAAVRSLGASPVLGVPAGSISIIRHSWIAEGLCSTPRRTTNISPARSATSPSRR